MLFLAALLPLLLFVTTKGAVVTTTQSPAECHAHALDVCNRTANVAFTYCSTDGKVYHDLCSLALALCDNHDIKQDPNNPECFVPTTTAKPLTIFETSLFAAIQHGIDDRLHSTLGRGIDPNRAKLIFSVQDHANKHYVRNPDCWASDLDLTCISPWNSDLHNRKGSTLISPRHAVWARHYSIRTNSTLRFVTRDGSVVDRTIVDSRAVQGDGGTGYYGRDIVVGVLDQDVPDTISFAKVLPHQIMTIIPPPHDIRLPILSTDMEEKALVSDLFALSGTTVGLHNPLTSSPHHDFYEAKVSGDGGNPSFFVIGDELVLLFTLTTTLAGRGTYLGYHHDEINQIMGQLGGGTS